MKIVNLYFQLCTAMFGTLIINYTIHELGHLTIGCAMDFKLEKISVLFVSLISSKDKLKVKLIKIPEALVLVIPKSVDRISRNRLVAFYSGGPLVTLLVIFLSFVNLIQSKNILFNSFLGFWAIIIVISSMCTNIRNFSNPSDFTLIYLLMNKVTAAQYISLVKQIYLKQNCLSDISVLLKSSDLLTQYLGHIMLLSLISAHIVPDCSYTEIWKLPLQDGLLKQTILKEVSK